MRSIKYGKIKVCLTYIFIIGLKMAGNEKYDGLNKQFHSFKSKWMSSSINDVI